MPLRPEDSYGIAKQAIELELEACRRVFGEDGRPMHKSWGNAIEFDEAADRMGVDVMRWMFVKARP